MSRNLRRSVSHLLLLSVVGLSGCISNESTQTEADVPVADSYLDSGVDRVLDTDVEAEVDPPDAIPDLVDDTDIDGTVVECGPNEVPSGDSCACAEGFVEASDGACVMCTNNSHCDGRVCVGYTCRNCSSHDECSPLYCG